MNLKRHYVCGHIGSNDIPYSIVAETSLCTPTVSVYHHLSVKVLNDGVCSNSWCNCITSIKSLLFVALNGVCYLLL